MFNVTKTTLLKLLVSKLFLAIIFKWVCAISKLLLTKNLISKKTRNLSSWHLVFLDCFFKYFPNHFWCINLKKIYIRIFSVEDKKWNNFEHHKNLFHKKNSFLKVPIYIYLSEHYNFFKKSGVHFVKNILKFHIIFW